MKKEHLLEEMLSYLLREKHWSRQSDHTILLPQNVQIPAAPTAVVAWQNGQTIVPPAAGVA